MRQQFHYPWLVHRVFAVGALSDFDDIRGFSDVDAHRAETVVDNKRFVLPCVVVCGRLGSHSEVLLLWRRQKHEAAGTRPLPQLEKARIGIAGFDEITNGGVPKGRPTIICGGPGCGKTMFAVEFLVRGAIQFGEPGVLMTFEETAAEMTKNVASLGFDLKDLSARKKFMMDYVRIEPSEIQETGSYDLEGLFIRLQYAVDSIGAKRVVLDTLEAVFSGFSNQGLLRAEIRRLFRWLKDRGLTTIVTAERGDGTLTRYGLEEYVSDCVIFLDHRVTEQVSTRRMRVIKYRGSSHGADEYPFLIDEQGFSVLPSTSMGLNHPVSSQRISSGVKELDDMLEGKGYFRGSSVMISGTAGSGKSSLAAHLANQTCVDGKRCLHVAFEESPLRHCETCGRSALISSRMSKKDCYVWKRGGLRRAAWKCICSGSTSSWNSYNPARRDPRSNYQSDDRQHARSSCDVDASDGFSEDEANYGVLHRADAGRRGHGADRGANLVAHRYMDAGARCGAEW